LRWLAVLLHPVMPERTAEMWRQLGSPGKIDEDWSRTLSAWGGLAPGTRIAAAAPLFPKIDHLGERSSPK
jgi:methionyl-tRNA synthetase